MKPFLAVVANVYVVAAYVLGLRRHGYPVTIISAHVFRAFIALFWMCRPCLATTLVVIAEPRHHRIVIAADSLVRRRYRGAELECKIHVTANDCAFAMAGLYSLQIPAFDLFSLGQDACRSSGDLKERADKLLSVGFPQIVKVVKYLATTDPDYLKREFEGKPVMQVFFIGAYKGQAAVFARGAVLENGMLKPEATGVPFDTTALFSGVNDHIVSYINSHPKWDQYGAINTTRRLVTIEAHAHPTMVALPISIGSVDSDGRFRWIDRGECKQQK